MAARVLLQQRAAPLAVCLLAGGMTLSGVAYAEAPEAYTHSPKKPIYDSYEPFPTASTLPLAKPKAPTTANPEAPTAAAQEKRVPPPTIEHRRRGPTPTDRLAGQIRHARLFLYRHAATAEDAVNAGMSRAFHLEKSFTDTVASLAPPPASGERLMPGLVYVLVAAMAGSIVARRSNVLVRAALPVAFGVGAGWAVLPATMRNVGDLAWRYESRFPSVAESHVRVRGGLERGWSFAKVHTQVGRQMVDDRVHDTREAIEQWLKKGK